MGLPSKLQLTIRKIRCCGGSPCRNCSRSHRECEYAPVPEEINRQTRERKAIAKATKTTHFASPVAPYSPYFAETPTYNVPYVAPQRPVHLAHRRSVSVPVFDNTPWVAPPTPQLHSPATFESSQWQYNGWCSGPPIPQAPFPSVFTHPQPSYMDHQHPSTPPESRSHSTDVDPQWSTPSLHLRVPALTPSRAPHSPISPLYYSPHPTPPLYQSNMFPSPLGQQTNSPTLAPEMAPQKDLVGLGIGMQPAYQEEYHY